jgi:hypothetical protein
MCEVVGTSQKTVADAHFRISEAAENVEKFFLFLACKN